VFLFTSFALCKCVRCPFAFAFRCLSVLVFIFRDLCVISVQYGIRKVLRSCAFWGSLRIILWLLYSCIGVSSGWRRPADKARRVT
jgi:hypothetical protein